MIKIACLLPVWAADDAGTFEVAVDSLMQQQLNENLELTIFFCLDGVLEKAHHKVIDDASLTVPTVCVENIYSNGLPNNLNCGLKEILNDNFDYIARMDADDVCVNNRFLVQLSFLQQNPDVDVVGSWSAIIDSESQIIGEKRVPEDINLEALTRSCNVIHPTLFFKREFFVKFGFYDGDYLKSQDWELWLRAVTQGANMKNIQQPLLNLRIDNNLVDRRRSEQSFNRKIISNYSTGIFKYIFIFRSWLIELLPSFILRYLVHRAYRK